MKPPSFLVYPCALLGCLTSLAQAQDLRGNAFFRSLSGIWKGQGQITDAGEQSQLLRNRIEAAFDDTGTLFTIKGSLIVGEDNGGLSAEPVPYRWEFRRSQAEGLFDGRLFVLSGDGQIQDYEVSIDEANLTARLLQVSGTSGEDRFELTKQIVGEEYVVRITSVKPSGEVTATGEMRFRRDS